MAIFEYLKAFRRRWILILGCFMLATAIGYAVSPEEPSEPEGAGFEASQTLIPSQAVTTAEGVNLHLAAHLATGPDVARLAAQKLPAGVTAPEPDGVTAEVSPEANSLIIRLTDHDRTRAGLLAQTYATATIEFFQASTVQSQGEELEDAQAALEDVTQRIEELEQQRIEDPENVVIQAQIQAETSQFEFAFQRVHELINADEPTAPLQVLGTAEVTELDPGFIQPPDDRRVRALLVGAVGLLLGLGLAITVDRLDTRLRERDEVEDAFGLPVLAEIPTVGKRARADHALVTELKPNSVAADAYRSLRSAITLVSKDPQSPDSAANKDSPYSTPQVLVVAGADGSQGKSTTVANLAAAIAETGRSVLVIDCDFRKPEAHLFLDARSRSNLAGLSTGYFSGYLDQMVRQTAVQGVELVSSIEPVRDHSQVVSRLPGLISDARGRADVILIDSSPLLVTSDAVDVLRYADAALVACRVGQTTYAQATRARRLLQRADVKLLGVVLSGTPRRRGTPYGQPSRSQRLLRKLGKSAGAPGPDSYDQFDTVRHSGERSQPERTPEISAPVPPTQPAVREQPAQAHSGIQDPVPVAAGPTRRERRSDERRTPLERRPPEHQPDESSAPEPRSREQVRLDEQPTMEFSTVEAAAAAAGDSLPAHYRTNRDRRSFEDRAEAAARKVPTDSSSD